MLKNTSIVSIVHTLERISYLPECQWFSPRTTTFRNRWADLWNLNARPKSRWRFTDCIQFTFGTWFHRDHQPWDSTKFKGWRRRNNGRMVKICACSQLEFDFSLAVLMLNDKQREISGNRVSATPEHTLILIILFFLSLSFSFSFSSRLSMSNIFFTWVAFFVYLSIGEKSA